MSISRADKDVEVLEIALQHHQAGRLDQAEILYRQVVERQPQNAPALHLLGVLALQRGDPQQAVERIDRAVALQPGVAPFHANLAEAYRMLGQLDRAVSCCHRALRLQPDFPEAANCLGLILLARGQAGAAADQFRTALRQRPDFALAHTNLGNALLLLGSTDQALVHFRQAVQLAPNLALARSNLGQLLLECKQLPEALEHCRAAVRLQPAFALAQNNLGNVLRELGRLAEAKACYAEALRLQPDLAMVHSNIGQALQEEERLDEALNWYHQALKLDPQSARIHTKLAGALAEQEDYTRAIPHYETALRLDPNHAEAHNGLGFVRHEQGRHDEALASYRQALRLKPDLAEAESSLGTVLEELGDFAGAEAAFRAALAHDPRDCGAHAQLATLLRGRLPEADLAALQQLLAGSQLSPRRRCPLHYALAQVLDARGQYAEAAAHLEQANALDRAGRQQRGRGYDPALHARFVDRLLAAFTAEFFQHVRSWGLEVGRVSSSSSSERPVFLFGLPRSGTTLLEQILASHSQVHGAGELRFGRESFEALVGGKEEEIGAALGRLDRHTVQRLAQEHLDKLQALDAAAARVTDKMPDNYLYLGLLATLFPRAKFIHCRRDLRDVAVSCWVTHFRQINWASDPEHIAQRFREYRRLMDHWRCVLPVRFLEVDYEEAVADLEGVARRLVDWCGLEWEPACLAFHETVRPVQTASVTQVRQPIYTRSVGRWKNYAGALAPLLEKVSGEG